MPSSTESACSSNGAYDVLPHHVGMRVGADEDESGDFLPYRRHGILPLPSGEDYLVRQML